MSILHNSVDHLPDRSFAGKALVQTLAPAIGRVARELNATDVPMALWACGALQVSTARGEEGPSDRSSGKQNVTETKQKILGVQPRPRLVKMVLVKGRASHKARLMQVVDFAK